MASRVVTVNDVLDGHVRLDLECLDRIYLNGYVPNLQVGGQVVSFLTAHLGFPIPSPAIFDQIGGRFRRAVATFARDNAIPVVGFGKGDRKIEVMGPYLEAAAAGGVSKVAAIGVAQGYAKVFTGTAREPRGGGEGGAPWFCFAKADRRVTCYYFYLWDEDFGPGFVKVCCYFPYPMKIWINGHEWAKRQAIKAGIGFTALSNGFATCQDPQALQAICDRLGPGVIRVFCERWWARLPLPLTAADRAGGYWWDISMRQVEVCRTIVFEAPRSGRAFFEALIGDNLDIGRPDSVEVIFGGKVTARTPGTFTTRVITRGVDVTVNAYYKRSRIKQYLKDGRALRVETVVNDTTDLGVKRRLEHLDVLQAKARDVNRRLVDTERVGQGCVLASPAFERVARATVADGRRAAAPERPDRPPRTLQHLRPDPRRHQGRGVLHQGPRPAPPAVARSRPTTRPAPDPTSPTHPRPRRRRLHHQRPNDRLKTWLNSQPGMDQTSLEMISVAWGWHGLPGGSGELRWTGPRIDPGRKADDGQRHCDHG
jgi:hypothetical protein